MINTHANKRINQRGITDEQIEACLKYGKETASSCAYFYVLGKKEIKKHNLNSKWHGTVIIMENGIIATVFINKNFKLYTIEQF